ncbi:MAG: hypothetical protein NZ900_06235 [Synergistetes bacterium]|nr:hypothetical protein [Synergistota bacterium]MDW8192522.1 hypothetical protein [Synergistota bacterium]
MFKVKGLKIVFGISILLLWIWTGLASANDKAHILPHRIITENDLNVYFPWYFYERLYTWSDIERYTTDHGLLKLKDLIDSYVSYYDSVYLYGLSMKFRAHGMGNIPLSIEIPSLIYNDGEDIVIAFNEFWGNWEVIDRDSLGAYISSISPLTIVVGDNSDYDGSSVWWEIRVTLVIAKVYTYGGGGCEVGGVRSLSWLLLLAPVVLMKFKLFR